MSHRYVPTSGRDIPRFAGIKTFFRLPYVDIAEDYELGIVGVPFDGGASYRPGQRFAPVKVREASSLGRVFHMGRMSSFSDKIKVADVGDVPTVPNTMDLNGDLVSSDNDINSDMESESSSTKNKKDHQQPNTKRKQQRTHTTRR